MNFNLRIFLVILLFVAFYMIFKYIKSKRLSMKYGLYWTLIFLTLLLLIIFPTIVEKISDLCGFEEAPNMLFLISTFILFYIVFRINTSLSKLQQANREIVQEISIMKKNKK